MKSKYLTLQDVTSTMLMFVFLFALCFCFSGCTTPPVVTSEPPAPVVVKQPYPSIGWHDDFDDMIVGEVYRSKLLSLPGSRMNFCPQWDQLATPQKAREIANLFHGIAKYESGFKLTTHFHEKDQGIDNVTKLPKYSDGLFQLSYSDNYLPGCKVFDWNKDKNLDATDVNRTIYQPENQVKCAVAIANTLMSGAAKNENALGVGKYGLGRYWHVFRIDSKWSRIKQRMIEYESQCFE